MTDVPVPNPGSSEAIKQGCKCPVVDNNHGHFPPYPPSSWYINEHCPIHVIKEIQSE